MATQGSLTSLVYVNDLPNYYSIGAKPYVVPYI